MTPKPLLLLRRTWPHSLLWRAALYSVATAAVITVGLTIIATVFASALAQQQMYELLTATVSSSEHALQTQLQTAKHEIAQLADRIGIEMETQSITDEDEGNTWLQESLHAQRLRHSGLRSLVLFNVAGQPLWPTTDVDLPQPLPNQTVLLPTLGRHGWESFDVITPVTAPSGDTFGWLVARYDTELLLQQVLPYNFISRPGGAILFGVREGDDLLLLHHGHDRTHSYAYNVGRLALVSKAAIPVAIAVNGNEGLGEFTDHDGNNVLAAFRFLPDLGWGLVVQIHKSAALSGVAKLTSTLAIIGLLAIAFAVILSLSFAKSLTRPLRALSTKVNHLRPGHWRYRQTVRSGDEVAHLDNIIAKLTARLRKMYEHLEDEVSLRTEELRKDAAKDKAILKSINFGLLVVDPKGRITEANPSAATILKRDFSSIIGESVDTILDIREHQTPVVKDRNPIQVCLKTRKDVLPESNLHLTVTCADNTHLSVRISVSPLLEGRKLLGAIVLFQDITTERQLDYMKTEFITLASHQLRTPLASVQWYLELLSTEEQERLSEEQKSFIVELRLAAHRMNNIVTELMDAARLGRDGVEPTIRSVNVRQFAQDLVEEMKIMAKKQGVTIKTVLPKQTTVINTDPMLLSIVLQNLLSNAVKYSRRDGVVTVQVKKTKASVSISVEDNGIGIPHADQDRIFEKLFRARNAQTKEVNGSGLGLYSSQMIMEQLGGRIRFESVEGKGSTFTVVFPIEKK